MDNKALFDIIDEALTDDYTLPEGFSLPSKEGGLNFADGAQDGIWIYHMPHEDPTPEQMTIMADAVWAVSIGDHDKADELFLKLSSQIQPLAYIDKLQDLIMDNRQTLSIDAVVRYMMRCLTQSSEKDLVKTGLALAELIEFTKDDDLASIIRTLALSDEFTVFCIYKMKHWVGGNQELFALAKRVHGWGRIHCVAFLEPETDAIREWLLTEGVHNDVLSAYSALDCWEKSGAAKRLEGRLTQREFEGIRDIIEGLLDEGPCEGISGVGGIDNSVRTFLARAKEFRLGPKDYGVINGLKEYYADKGRAGEFIARLCEDLIKEM